MPDSDEETIDSTAAQLAAELEELVKQQFDSLERLKKELINAKKLEKPKRTLINYNVRLERSAENRKQFLATHQKIINYDAASKNDYMTNDICDAFETEYASVISEITAIRDSNFPPSVVASPINTTATGSSGSFTYQISTPTEPPFKLPTLTLQEFDGKYTDWLSFYDSFMQIHTHERLTNHHKFLYLKSALTPSVKSVIGYLDITAENYQEAWDELVKRYNQKRVLFSHYMEQFMNQPIIRNETADELRTLHDVSRACVFSMQKLGIDVAHCSEVFAYLVIQKLPQAARLEWEKHLGTSKDIPKFNALVDFLEFRFRTFESTYPNQLKSDSKQFTQNHQSKQSFHSSHKSSHRKETKSFHVSAKSLSCPLCEQPHILRKCMKFLQMSTHERKILVDKLKLCSNCLGHTTSIRCNSTNTCFTCNGSHHTLLHINKQNASPSQQQQFNNPSTSYTPTNPNVQLIANNLLNAKSNCVLLATALIDIPDINGQLIRLRALIDQGSQHSMITERASQRLRLPITSICVGVRPMGETQYKIVNRGLLINVHSTINPIFKLETIVAIIPSITSNLPLFPLNSKSWSHIQSLPLADPHFSTPGQIDLLLGGDVYGNIIQSGLCKGQQGEPIAQNTSLGWILSGEIVNQNNIVAFPVNCFHVSTCQIGEYIKKFYELEEVPHTRQLSKEDKWTDDHYNRTYQRQANGKFMVRLPFKSLYDPSIELGSSFSMALKRFQWLQRRFQRDNKFHNAYVQAFNEYKQLNQVELIDTITNDFHEPYPINHFYLPHHAVLKETSLTTKLRQVFDGSAKSSNGNSLNDILTTGPSLQSDIVSIILNWRVHKFAFIADIEKMYRCIDVHPDDIRYQQLIWEEDSQLKTYALKTVTFGVKPSPFLAIKTMHTLAELERDTYPLAHNAIKKETYVDDVTSGGETIEQTIALTNQLIQMLRGAGFELRKWASNSSEILNHIPTEYRDQNTTCLLNTSDDIKALGLCWSTTQDCFNFNVNFSVSHAMHTKRTVLSIIARLFDPLGWLSPFVTQAKLFLNKLWEANLDWDITLPSHLETEWKEVLSQFQFINQLKMPRWLNTTSQNIRNELHVFCDSSNKAYATVIYLRTIDSSNNIHTSLLIAKSKLTPVRRPLTTPRSELCGAVLAVNLLETVKENFRLEINKTFLWTDSSIVLSWIRGDPNRWDVFVANRIHKLLNSTNLDEWRHVVSEDNSADCNSRGLSITQLKESTLWWTGPKWLSLPTTQWPSSPFNIVDDDPDELRSKYKSINIAINEMSRLDSILLRFSNFNRLRYSFAYVLRYIHRLREVITFKRQKPSLSAQPIKHLITLIPAPTVDELEKAEHALIRWVQHDSFASEIKTLKTDKTVSRKSVIFRLTPFIDSNDMLRVNGRLRNAFIPYNEKYPLILPSKHRIVLLIVDFHHKQTFHGGAMVTINQIRQNYWITNIRNFTRHYIQKCVRCFKNKPNLSHQFMGSLPFPRVNNQSRPFSATIIDYAGPYDIRASKGRGHASHKGYVAIFTCMATKAVHLEAAGDLSTQTFLHAFDRFIARRGLCHDVYSDCGTNFVGASNDIQRTQAEFEEFFTKDVLPHLTIRNIKWHFSPPGAPHFNGLVEAAVKSMKFHFCRIIGQTKLTFEEFSTILARIEAVLNSRPISTMSSDPNDFTALTPGHFLIGSALLARPQPPTTENPIKRYQLMERLVQHFWQRFRTEVLSTMQIRTKWQDKQPNLNINDLVIIKDDRFPINQWPLGRVVDLHPGTDDLIRAVTIKTSHGMLKRPITKLCLVPTPHDI